jgi:hypothetical protein
MITALIAISSSPSGVRPTVLGRSRLVRVSPRAPFAGLRQTRWGLGWLGGADDAVDDRRRGHRGGVAVWYFRLVCHQRELRFDQPQPPDDLVEEGGELDLVVGVCHLLVLLPVAI